MRTLLGPPSEGKQPCPEAAETLQHHPGPGTADASNLLPQVPHMERQPFVFSLQPFGNSGFFRQVVRQLRDTPFQTAGPLGLVFGSCPGADYGVGKAVRISAPGANQLLGALRIALHGLPLLVDPGQYPLFRGVVFMLRDEPRLLLGEGALGTPCPVEPRGGFFPPSSGRFVELEAKGKG